MNTSTWRRGCPDHALQGCDALIQETGFAAGRSSKSRDGALCHRRVRFPSASATCKYASQITCPMIKCGCVGSQQGGGGVALAGAFVRRAAEQQPELPPLVACFYAVRDLPYALDGAHDAAGLLDERRGDCMAKSELLKLAADELGVPARFVRWRYLLPEVVAEVAELPSRLDVHRAVQVNAGQQWLLADATHHRMLRHTPLVVSEWDGRHDSQPAYPPLGAVMVEGMAQAAVEQACEDARRWTTSCPQDALARWRSAYIAWLRQYETATACPDHQILVE